MRRYAWFSVLFLVAVLGWSVLSRAFSGVASTDPLKVTAAALVGSWQSVDDPKFVRAFTAEGKCTELYDGRPVVKEEYHLYTAENVPKEQVPAPAPGTVYLTIGGVGQDMLVFSVVRVTDGELELTYLARGNTLRFNRM